MIDDAIFVCLLDELILGFCYSDLRLETGGFELASTISLLDSSGSQASVYSFQFIIAYI